MLHLKISSKPWTEPSFVTRNKTIIYLFEYQLKYYTKGIFTKNVPMIHAVSAITKVVNDSLKFRVEVFSTLKDEPSFADKVMSFADKVMSFADKLMSTLMTPQHARPWVHLILEIEFEIFKLLY